MEPSISITPTAYGRRDFNYPFREKAPADPWGFLMNVRTNEEVLRKEIQALEDEIREIEKRIPPHSVRYEILQLLEEKEEELERKRYPLRLNMDETK